MTISPELLAAFADDQLDGDEARTIGALVAADPDLQRQVDAHRALRARLAAHFAPLTVTEVPERLRAAVFAPPERGEVVEFAAASAMRQHQRKPGGSWRYFVPAIAASLVVAVLGFNAWQSQGYANGALAEALDHQLAATAPANAPVRVLISFRDSGGQFCRAYAAGPQGGIACRDDRGWRLRFKAGAANGQQTDFRQAGSDDAAVMAAAQAMAVGPALDAGEEATAARRNWRP